ncbi:type 1 glutamine amidotransferase [[Actinomadura] parvosata]|uniref:type 1 glutamine amidotransferase n=1 Tax=[Actinomadura] parvosata TaxID=1955412 RepID=UPI00406BFEEB
MAITWRDEERCRSVDTPSVLVLATSSFWSAGWLVSWIPEAGLRADYVRPFRGDPIPSPLTYAGLVILAGATPVYADSDAPWQPGARSLVASAVEAGIPTLGICYGAQLIAAACGGHVSTMPDGPEIGLLPVRLSAAAARDPLLAATTAISPAVLWHHDEVTRLPAGGVLLASTSACAHQAFRIGESAWGLQFHPEATISCVRQWARAYAHDIWAMGSTPEDVVSAVRRGSGHLLSTWRPVIDRFLSIVIRRTGMDTPVVARTA